MERVREHARAQKGRERTAPKREEPRRGSGLHKQSGAEPSGVHRASKRAIVVDEVTADLSRDSRRDRE